MALAIEVRTAVIPALSGIIFRAAASAAAVAVGAVHCLEKGIRTQALNLRAVNVPQGIVCGKSGTLVFATEPRRYIPLSVYLAKLVAESIPSSGKDRVIGDLGQLPGFEIL